MDRLEDEIVDGFAIREDVSLFSGVVHDVATRGDDPQENQIIVYSGGQVYVGGRCLATVAVFERLIARRLERITQRIDEGAQI